MWTSKVLLLDLETLILHHGIRKFTNLWHLWGSIFEVNMIICLSSHSEVFYKKSVLKNFGKLTRKHLCRSVFFKKLETSTLQLYLKDTLAQVVLRTHFLYITSGWLLLNIMSPLRNWLVSHIKFQNVNIAWTMLSFLVKIAF